MLATGVGVTAAVPVEPLLESAALAERLAPAICTPSPARCDWYHALYPRLRVFGLAATPERHARFYDAVLRRLALAGHERIAVTGTADTCMLAHVLRAYGTVNVRPAVTVVDRCATPLRLCAAYAQLAAREIEVEVADLLAWRPGQRFDVITTHALIGLLPPARQPELLRSWRLALRPGGVLVSVARIDPEWSPQTPGFSAAQAEAFCALVARRARAADVTMATDQATLGERVRRYVRRMRSFPFASQDALVARLEEAGLHVEHLELVRCEGRAGDAESGPGAHRSGTFAHFVCSAAKAAGGPRDR